MDKTYERCRVHVLTDDGIVMVILYVPERKCMNEFDTAFNKLIMDLADEKFNDTEMIFADESALRKDGEVMIFSSKPGRC
jgi:hypothetical protein